MACLPPRLQYRFTLLNRTGVKTSMVISNPHPASCTDLHSSPSGLPQKPLMGLKRGGTQRHAFPREPRTSPSQYSAGRRNHFRQMADADPHLSPLPHTTPPEVLQWGLAECAFLLAPPISESAPDQRAQSQPSTCWRAGLPHTRRRLPERLRATERLGPKAGSTGCAAPPKSPHCHLLPHLPQAASTIHHPPGPQVPPLLRTNY